MKSMTLRNLLLALGLLMSLGVQAAQGQEVTCCLADEWLLTTLSAESNCLAAEAQSNEVSCCLASEWFLPAGGAARVDSRSAVGTELAAGDYCCIAEEWKL